MHGTNYELSLNKLIVLYMIKNASIPLSNTHISEFVLDYGYTNYFSLQEYLNQMVEANLLATHMVSHTTMYDISSNGLTTLDYFENRIPDSTKKEIINHLKKHKYEIKSNVEITAEYIPENDGDYLVHCVAKENKKTLIDLKISTIDKAYAIKICNKWEKNSHEIYKLILNELID